MRELQRRSGATAQIGRGLLSLATAWLLVSQAAAQTFVRPGETKTFTPSFVVGSGVVDGQTYTIKLKQVSPDVGIDPDPDDPASEIEASFRVDGAPPELTIPIHANRSVPAKAHDSRHCLQDLFIPRDPPGRSAVIVNLHGAPLSS